jgi:alcohol dehydrogenase class IV
VLGEPLQVQARGQLSLAALEAGLAFSQTRTALAHAASYDLTLSRGISHGAAVAVWLPEVWSLACGRDAQADAALAGVFHSPALEGPQRLRRWLDEVGFDLTLGALGIADPKGVLTAALQQPRGRNFLEAAGG